MIKDVLRVNRTARMLREYANAFSKFKDSPFPLIQKYLRRAKITHIFDVGANIGQFGVDIIRTGYNGHVISYEPVLRSFNKLNRLTQKYDKWTAFQMGMGAFSGNAIINVSGNSALSSSILDIGQSHLENFPRSKTISQESVILSTVDDQIELLNINPSTVMLKIDVQGYEKQVLLGSMNYLSTIPLCYLEVSLSPLYIGEAEFPSIINMITSAGHNIVDIHRGVTAKDGTLLQIDILSVSANLR